MTAPTPDPGALLDRLEEAEQLWHDLINEDDQGAVDKLADLLRLARDGLALRDGVERVAEELRNEQNNRARVAGATPCCDAADRLRAVVADTSGEGQ